MSKELEAVKKIGTTLIRNYDNTKGGNGYAFFGEELKIIEKALERLEEQDDITNLLKDIIKFNRMVPELKIEENDNDFYKLLNGVTMQIEREIENKERELLRNWILKTCFPKELKALEIIKKHRTHIAVGVLLNDLPEEEYQLLKEILK